MLKAKNGEQLNALCTGEFAEEILNNHNKIFCFLTKPEDDYCFFLASVDIFGTQSVTINGGRFIKDSVVPYPDFAFTFNIPCFDVEFGYADSNECIPDIVDGLKMFAEINSTGEQFYIIDDNQNNRLETVHHWDE